jgi:hypothetical protein
MCGDNDGGAASLMLPPAPLQHSCCRTGKRKNFEFHLFLKNAESTSVPPMRCSEFIACCCFTAVGSHRSHRNYPSHPASKPKDPFNVASEPSDCLIEFTFHQTSPRKKLKNKQKAEKTGVRISFRHHQQNQQTPREAK